MHTAQFTTTTTTQATTTQTSTLATDSPAEASEIQEQQTEPTEVTEIMADLIEHMPQEQLLEEQEEQQFPQEQQQQQEQTISHLALQTQDAAENVEGTIQDNEETEALHDSHNESAAVEEFGEQLSSDESDARPQQQQQNEREHFESSDDEDTAAEAVEMSAGFNEEWETLAEDLAHANDASNDLDNRIDGDETFVPIDLSNDIAVNDIAAAQQDFPHNPDAELIDVVNSSSNVQVLPKFEKLTLAVPAAPEQLHQQQQSEQHVLVK